MQVACLALGSRGDVQPLLALCAALAEQGARRVVLVTHAAHQGWVEEPAARHGVQLCWLSSPPARVWQAGGAAKRKAAGEAAAAPQPPGAAEEQQREQLVEACEDALGLRVPDPDAGAKRGPCPPVQQQQQQQQQQEQQQRQQQEPCTGSEPPTPLILFNLFALEGFHIAEALRVPCLAVSPCLVPHAAPAGLQRALEQRYPRLHQRLLAAVPPQQGGAGGVGWAEVRYWLWALLDEDRWGGWRYHRLGLPPLPYAQECNRGCPLPLPPPLLYGLSEVLVAAAGWWPPSVHVCGPWHHADCFACAELALPQPLAQLLASHPGTAKPVCVDLGSMGLMGLVPDDPRHLVASLAAAARRLQRPFVLLTAGWEPLLEACQQQQQQQQLQQQPQQQQQQLQSGSGTEQQQQQEQVLLVALERPVAHHVLLPHCAALLHPGGAGTVAAALLAGTPQLIAPLHFDQRQWAERVAWLGCGGQLPAQGLFGGDATMRQESAAGQAAAEAGEALAAALAALLEDGAVQASCRRVQEELQAQDGIPLAMRCIEQHLQEYRAFEGQQQEQQQQQHGQEEQRQRQQQEQRQRQEEPPEQQHAGQQLQQQQQPQRPKNVDASGHLLQSEEASSLLLRSRELVLPNGLLISCAEGAASEALFLYEEIFSQRTYEQHGITLPHGSTVIDAGANVGLFAMHLLLDPHTAPAVAHVWAFEPLPPSAALLKANLSRHGLEDRATVVQYALHRSAGTLPLTYYPHMPGNSTARPREKWQHQRPDMATAQGWATAGARFERACCLECPATTLAVFVAERGIPRIDLLKVDVEGCELDVLLGMDQRCWDITSQVVAEVHDVAGRLQAVCSLLEQEGFSVAAEQPPGLPAGNWMVYARREPAAAGDSQQ